ncbi:AAA family ATPase [Jiangella asiatica]|uniref:Zeta toxin n=1 Tax=Jiangella asiatica TaxID=2530372 RepID=A0A4R5CG49_9ACTN|nr:AAA family ATPase [Jiangella asiatica]TDD99081.1 Zeta toxin [Jiangella asiatica]
MTVSPCTARPSVIEPSVAPSSADSIATPERALVVVAGLPGAGKTSLLGRLEVTEPATVLDSDQVHRWVRARVGWPYRSYRLLVHLVHRLRVLWHAVAAPGTVVVHEPATRPGTRAALLLLGHVTGRARCLVWLDASAAEALDGQLTRARVLRPRVFARHVRRADELHGRFAAGWRPAGWTTVTIVPRAVAARGLRLLAVSADSPSSRAVAVRGVSGRSPHR